MENYIAPSFRDRPINIDETGKRKWIYAKQPKGKWYTRRTIFAWLCLTFLVVAPIIKVNGTPLMLFDIANRKFSLFGNIIWAQDSYILALVMLVIVVSVVLFTVIFGRLWCGWACPQTIFLEMVFRRIEYLFDGNYRHGKKKQAVNLKTTIRRIAKHICFFLAAIIITNVILDWFVGPVRLLEIIREPVEGNMGGFLFMLGISIFYYWIYAFFREQVCTMVCPYGRMQGVLLDSNSISVIYDFKRGDPRGAKAAGDCINCGQCIAVCPTGIDIKNGSQLECTNCTACIDECNSVMKKIKKPKNLIRFDSYNAVITGKKSIGNARSYAYSAVLLILVSLLIIIVSQRTPVDATMLRVPGTIYQVVDSGVISNMYTLKIINKTQFDKHLSFRLKNIKSGSVQIAGKDNLLKKYGSYESILIIKLKKMELSGKVTDVTVGIYEDNTLLKEKTLNFIGPL